MTQSTSGSSGSCTGNAATATRVGTTDINANVVYAGPGSGTTGVPSFRAIVAADINGDLTQNTSGSSGSCTGNAATATRVGTTDINANVVYAGPNGTTGVPSFREIVADDIPTLNQNTTGTANKAKLVAPRN